MRHTILAIAFTATAISAAAETPNEALAKACANDGFSGVVLVTKAGKPVMDYRCGYADKARTIAFTADTPMRIASVGKVFTAVAVLQLVEKGKISLDAPLKRYLPDYPNKELADKVTIRHLLTHTGGTGDIFGQALLDHAGEMKTLADYVGLFGARGPEFEPGSKRAYSNYGFILLGLVIERVTGQSYFDYVQKNVFDRAGMSGASFPIEMGKPAGMSVGYVGTANARTPAPAYWYRGTSCGGGFASAADLTHFSEALMAGKLVSKKMLAHIVAGDLMAAGQGYAYGFDRKTDAKGRLYLGHGGNGTGISAVLHIYPETGMVAVVLSNYNAPAAGDAFKLVEDALP